MTTNASDSLCTHCHEPIRGTGKHWYKVHRDAPMAPFHPLCLEAWKRLREDR